MLASAVASFIPKVAVVEGTLSPLKATVQPFSTTVVSVFLASKTYSVVPVLSAFLTSNPVKGSNSTCLISFVVNSNLRKLNVACWDSLRNP